MTRYICGLIVILFLSSCTSNHRIVAIYESGDATQGPISVLNKPSQVVEKTVVQQPKAEEKEDAKAEKPSSILDSFKSNLP